ncbi:class F sortase [Thermogemmatispora sp.]|uniref:class F sortase n=1 Tax=Thermogemmatispora sp. TaxID=1968838 RepID=UPI001DEB95DF|nr:class F sortase [Thermogemmatispora sp.]MBX5448666.1 class F sortase [Thermogemmatispora sp.]
MPARAGEHFQRGQARSSWKVLGWVVVVLVWSLLIAGCHQPKTAATQVRDGKPSPSREAWLPDLSPQRGSRQAPGQPLHLRIPAIGVDAAIEPVGVTTSGELAVPARQPWDAVGWYQLGPRPGERGSAVIDGHLDRPGGAPAVFWRLRELQPGSLVQVLDTQGQWWSFRVRALAFYPPAQAPLQQIFADTSGHYLNLITCAGDWIASQHQTRLRLVVYTTLIS